MRESVDHLLSLDLNLLEPLYALLEEKHVTRAAQRCHLSQPAMSRAFERLRATFKDELLVRTARAYARTAYGERLLSDLRDVVPRLESVLLDRRFEPATSRHRFRLAATDFAANVLMPELLHVVTARAPMTTIDVVPFNETSFTKLESGTLDLVIACAQDSPLLENELLFTDEFVCVTAAGTSLPERRVSLDDYVALRHAVVDVSRGCQPLIDGVLAQRSCERRSAFTTTSHLSAALVAAKSALVCTTARRFAVQLQPVAQLRLLEAPVEFGEIEYRMAWQRRTREDAAQTWLRDRIREVSQLLSKPTNPSGHKFAAKRR